MVSFLWFFLFSNQIFAAVEPAQILPKVETYDELVQAIRVARNTSRERMEQAVEQEKVREAWEIGKLIDVYVLRGKERAEYSKGVLSRLAKDLDMSYTELHYMLEFARTYPILPAPVELSWSHYRELLTVNDKEEREAWTVRAKNEKLSSQQLRDEIHKFGNPSKPGFSPETLSASPGTVGCYQIRRATVGPYAGELVLDLGFSNYLSLQDEEGKFTFQEGEIVQAKKGALEKKKDAHASDLFTYKAYVYEVIDGDTFTAVIYLGFGFTTFQKLRLRGLDAPEIETREGQEAKAFLQAELPIGKPVLIRAVKSDKYDRYLADVFVDEVYVNQQLVSRNLATIMEV